MSLSVLVSAEHASNYIPDELLECFTSANCNLQSNESYDPELASIIEPLHKKFHVPCFLGNISKLAIDFNRPLKHPNIFSAITAPLTEEIHGQLIDKYYKPYRQKVEDHIVAELDKNRVVVHLSFHTFGQVAPVAGKQVDVGLLYDARKYQEKLIADYLSQSIKSNSDFTVRRNYPYKGLTEGFIAHLRNRFVRKPYFGFEIELNQNLVKKAMNKVCIIILEALHDTSFTQGLFSKEIFSNGIETH